MWKGTNDELDIMGLFSQAVKSTLLGPNILFNIQELPGVSVWQTAETDGSTTRILQVSVTDVIEGAFWLSYCSVLIKQNHGSGLKREYKMQTCTQIRNDKDEDNSKTWSLGREKKTSYNGGRCFQLELWGLKSHRKWNRQDEGNGAKIGPESTWLPHANL